MNEQVFEDELIEDDLTIFPEKNQFAYRTGFWEWTLDEGEVLNKESICEFVDIISNKFSVTKKQQRLMKLQFVTELCL